MHVAELELTGFRNLQDGLVRLDAAGNWLVGPNGSGKTSFLEALFFLSSGRSFRSSSTLAPVKYGESLMRVCGSLVRDDLSRVRLALERRRDGTMEGRVGESAVGSASRLAEALAVQLLDASRLSLVTGGPAYRRRFIDWGAFHVERGYADLFRRFRRALAQRNAALFGPDAVLDQWDAQLSAIAADLDQVRSAYCRSLVAACQNKIAVLLSRSISVSYQRGWQGDFADVLATQRAADRLRGRTLKGPHRADLQLRTQSGPVSETLSRGQQKMLAYALVMAQSQDLTDRLTKRPVVLVDDLLAELDVDAANAVHDELRAIGSQFFVTGVDRQMIKRMAGDAALFHVEQGRITPAHRSIS